MSFENSREYLEYWKDRVGTASDGTKVSGEDIQEFFIDLLKIKRDEKVLDLGCSFGRLCKIINSKTPSVFGMDVDYSVIDEAIKEPYVVTIKGRAEDTPFPSLFFDHVISWAVFDMVPQEDALFEVSRILKPGGKLLFTGKNADYCKDDEVGFVAERNAKLKKFPNHFTDVYKLIEKIGDFGFKFIRGFAFERRGDFGENVFFEIDSSGTRKFYEFLLIMEKLEDTPDNRSEELKICSGTSCVAQHRASENSFEDVVEYFKFDVAKEKEYE